MIALEDLYFEWLLSCIDSNGVEEGVVHVCGLLHNCEFRRRVGNDINRAVDGADLRKEFLAYYKEATFNQNEIDSLLMKECSWLEMLIPLVIHLDYLYEGGVKGRFIELLDNMRLSHLCEYSSRRTRASTESDQQLVDNVTSAIDNNKITVNGHGGLFPLRKRGHDNQKEVEIWNQQSSYFNERLEGAMWTSTE